MRHFIRDEDGITAVEIIVGGTIGLVVTAVVSLILAWLTLLIWGLVSPGPVPGLWPVAGAWAVPQVIVLVVGLVRT